MSTLYDVLGVPKTASDEEIRAAYRKLVKANHPDLNPGNKHAEGRFKEISAAYAIVGDTEKRKRYAGQIDETGAERPDRQYYRQYAETEPGFKYEWGGELGGYDDLGGIFSELFGRVRPGEKHGARAPLRSRGADVRYKLAVDFLEAVNGCKKRIDLPDGRSIDVLVPAGIEDGQKLRLSGMGGLGIGGGLAGHAIVEVAIRPHPLFRREGATIKSVLPITLKEALAGASVRVETVTGPIELRVPNGSNSGNVLRLRGKGVTESKTSQRGDHLIELRIVLPEKQDAELERLVSEWEAQHPNDPRSTLGGGS